jgi:hypothetical protein
MSRGRQITFVGGEPTLHPHITECVAHAHALMLFFPLHLLLVTLSVLMGFVSVVQPQGVVAARAFQDVMPFQDRPRLTKAAFCEPVDHRALCAHSWVSWSVQDTPAGSRLILEAQGHYGVVRSFKDTVASLGLPVRTEHTQWRFGYPAHFENVDFLIHPWPFYYEEKARLVFDF